MKITRTKDDLMRELLETKRELSTAKGNLIAKQNVLEDVLKDRDKLSAQVRNLTAEKSLWESRNSSGGRVIGEMRRQRSEALQAVARIVSMLAETPENIRLSPPSAPKDEAPF